MNREIKFRALNNLNEFEYGYFTKDYSGQCYITSLDGTDTTPVHEGEIGQFTGLKDKNGVEIYEGDILICHEYDSSDCVQRIIQTFKNAVVGFGFGSYYYYPKGNMNCPHQLLMYAYKPEIIGNIHQNPELIG